MLESKTSTHQNTGLRLQVYSHNSSIAGKKVETEELSFCLGYFDHKIYTANNARWKPYIFFTG